MRFGHAPLVIAVTRSRALVVLIAQRVPLTSSDVFCRRADQTGFSFHVLTADLNYFSWTKITD